MYGGNGKDYEQVAVKIPTFRDDEVRLSTYGTDSSGNIEIYLDYLLRKDLCSYSDDYLRWNIFHILVYYTSWGDLNEGWERINPVIESVKACPESDAKDIVLDAIKQYETYFDSYGEELSMD